jgi:hypothetical protein
MSSPFQFALTVFKTELSTDKNWNGLVIRQQIYYSYMKWFFIKKGFPCLMLITFLAIADEQVCGACHRKIIVKG